jgi:lysophospholipase L1-like esterase
MKPSNCPQCSDRVVALNRAIPEWATSKNTSDSPIVVVDCWTGFDPSRDTGDGVHPNNSGNEKLAYCWYEPLARAVKSYDVTLGAGGREAQY